MKRIFTILSFLLCILCMNAQTNNVTRKRSEKQSTTQTTTTPKKQSTTSTTQKKQTTPKKQSTTANSQRSSSSYTCTSPTIHNLSYTPNVNTYYANGVSFLMIEVRGGTFIMGGTNEQGSDAFENEKPTHNVTLSSYYIGETEVTQALWEAVMGESLSQIILRNNWRSYGIGNNYPMYDISWHDCKNFISKLNSITGKRFRMPTEAEWEFAARGGINSKGYKYSGSNTLDNVAWYANNSDLKTHEVATKQPNELGIYDMSGNVWEWCSDGYGYYSSSAQKNPTDPNSGSDRVNRGGSWNDDTRGCRSSGRYYGTPGGRGGILGLRLCLSE